MGHGSGFAESGGVDSGSSGILRGRLIFFGEYHDKPGAFDGGNGRNC